MTERLADAITDAARLSALRRTALLDSPPEEAFDRLTRLAASVLQVPVAVVSLVDGERQFFKSQCGMNEPLATTRQTAVHHSFCKHAVELRAPVLVPDLTRDPAFMESPLIAEFGVMAYAGSPLMTSDGHALGTCCVMDARPHAWSKDEVQVLQVLAASTMAEIELRRLAEELRSLTANLQGLVEARTRELRDSEERQRLLLDVNNAIVTCLDRDSLFAATATALARVVPYDRAALVLHDPVRDVFRVLGVAGPVPSPTNIPLGTEWPRHKSRAGWIFEHHRPILDVDLRDSPPFYEHPFLIQEGIRAAVSVPLESKGKMLGTLNVGSRTPGRYGEAELSLLGAIAEQVALALENLLAYEEIAALKSRLEEENLYLMEEVRTKAAFGDVVGESPAIQGVLADVRKVATTDSTVLVTGETGTGKELVVRAIHAVSRRKDKILVKVNCA